MIRGYPMSRPDDAPSTTPEAFGALIASEIVRWKPVIEQAGMRPE